LTTAFFVFSTASMIILEKGSIIICFPSYCQKSFQSNLSVIMADRTWQNGNAVK
jgi:hypothetical protein